MKYQMRNLWEALSGEVTTREAIVITGPRQAGKSTTLYWLLDQVNSNNKLLLDLTLESTRTLFEKYDAEGIVTQLRARGIDFSQRAFIGIDEIQDSKKVPKVVKYLIDHYQVKFFMTGSSAFYLKNQFSESMSGRKLLYELFPLSFQEYLDFKQVDYRLPSLFEDKMYILGGLDTYAFSTLQPYYEDFVKYGAFPAVALESDTTRKRLLLDEIYTSYIDLDVKNLADFTSIAELKKLIPLLAARVGSRINTNELSVVAGISQPTVRTYIDFLEKTYMIRLLPVQTSNVDVKTRKQSKVYFVDTGIASLVADISGGAKFENTLCHQLQRYGTLSYYDNRGEVDFVLKTNTTEYAFEAKETPAPLHKKALAKHGERMGIKNYNLIGRYESAKYDQYLWGGMIA